MKPKTKKQIRERKPLKEIIMRKNYSGEQSPYREWLETKGNVNQESDLLETKEANPDILAESEGMWHNPDTVDIQAIFEHYKPFLAPLQIKVIELVALEGKTLNHTAVILGITKSNVQKVIQSIQRKVKKLGYDL